MKNKKLLGILGITALLLAGNFAMKEAKEVDATNKQTIYFAAPDWWLADGASVGVHHWSDGGGTAWPGERASLVEGTTNTFSFELDKAHPNFIFTRINGGTGSVIDWGAKTPNLSLPDDGSNMYDASSSSIVWGDPGVSGVWKTYEIGSVTPVWEEVAKLTSKHFNDGYYVRNTEIYLNQTAIAEDLLNTPTMAGKSYVNLFHAKSDHLNRITYFEDDQLWMTNESGTINSGYGTTDDGKMNHFRYNNGVKNIDYTVGKTHKDWADTKVDGMEGFYITLKDIIPTEAQNWSKNGNIYSSSAPEMIEMFKAFTAPCYTGFADVPNYITFNHVEIEEKNSSLELRLYANSGDSDKLTSTGNLFSKAVISNCKVELAGSFNNWAPEVINRTDIGYVLDKELTVKTHELKVLYNGQWHGNEGTYKNFGEAWDFWGDNDNNCKLVISNAGKYSFKVEIGGTFPKLTITQK